MGELESDIILVQGGLENRSHQMGGPESDFIRVRVGLESRGH
jgi:hypothetical protein